MTLKEEFQTRNFSTCISPVAVHASRADLVDRYLRTMVSLRPDAPAKPLYSSPSDQTL